ncbi:hypothetical protein NDU88_003079 [Pleurodeles waltl]|uniref:Uncharacterized protein n=1 Tax=Pleurodeles waltl TaxID=8319 RepID=A0AAV7RBV5_PLEWA|nr:hypothetical protein NDU88_003079 [Pleurodeles waltl]
MRWWAACRGHFVGEEPLITLPITGRVVQLRGGRPLNMQRACGLQLNKATRMRPMIMTGAAVSHITSAWHMEGKNWHRTILPIVRMKYRAMGTQR